MATKSAYKKALKETDTIFSLLIRKKKSDGAISKCVTCSHTGPWRSFDNGHYCPRGCLATRFDEMNCWPQCGGCNGPGRGKLLLYRKFLVLKFGEKEVSKLEARASEDVKLKWFDLIEMRNKFRAEYESL